MKVRNLNRIGKAMRKQSICIKSVGQSIQISTTRFKIISDPHGKIKIDQQVLVSIHLTINIHRFEEKTSMEKKLSDVCNLAI